MKSGRELRAVCKGEAIGFTLDEPAQGSLSVRLQLGPDAPYCMWFGGRVIDDSGTSADGIGTFKAKNAEAPPTCPPP